MMATRSNAYVASMSAVKSVSSFTISVEKLGPLSTLKLMTLWVVTSFLFFKSVTTLGSGYERDFRIVANWSRVMSVIESVYS